MSYLKFAVVFLIFLCIVQIHGMEMSRLRRDVAATEKPILDSINEQFEKLKASVAEVLQSDTLKKALDDVGKKITDAKNQVSDALSTSGKP